MFLRVFIEVKLDIYNTESNQTIPFCYCIYILGVYISCLSVSLSFVDS